jgi:hypothetical protein
MRWDGIKYAIPIPIMSRIHPVMRLYHVVPDEDVGVDVAVARWRAL